MLRELSVHHLALIEDLRVELQPGYCAWTGETGAGKSLLLTALGLVLGEKATAELVRNGKQEAQAAAVFDVTEPGLRTDVEAILGGPLDETDLIVTRRVSATGRGSAHVNGLPVPLATLRRLGERLVGIHGQHEARDLLEPETQRRLLDLHAGLEPSLARYRVAREAHAAIRDRLLALQEVANRRLRERELLEFERDEIATIEPKTGEYDDLVHEAHRLAHAEELRQAMTGGYRTLYEDDASVQEQLAKLARRLAPLAALVPELSGPAADLERIADETREIARSLRGFSQSWEDDPNRLEAVESRLAQYRKLSTRFRCTPDALETREREVTDQLQRLERDDSDCASLEGPLRDAWKALLEAGGKLTQARRAAARGFGHDVQEQLRDLSLGSAKLSVDVVALLPEDDPESQRLPESGLDRVEFLFSPNPGEEAQALRKIASGGELARVTLAVKTVLAGADRTPTLVFDEIDTGVGGRLGGVLGQKLATLARHHQVICVTHLPQMACHAAHHWGVRKSVDGGRTRTTIVPLEENERIDELAVMLRGGSAGAGTRREALSMLTEAREAKAEPEEVILSTKGAPVRSRKGGGGRRARAS